MRLVKGLYSENPSQPGLFGLKHGQIVLPDSEVVIREAGWFNHMGEFLGCGDISVQNAFDIMCGIAEDELFIVLCAEDCRAGAMDWYHAVNRCRILFEKGHVHMVNEQTTEIFSSGFYLQKMHVIDRAMAQMVYARFIMKLRMGG